MHKACFYTSCILFVPPRHTFRRIAVYVISFSVLLFSMPPCSTDCAILRVLVRVELLQSMKNGFVLVIIIFHFKLFICLQTVFLDQDSDFHSVYCQTQFSVTCEIRYSSVSYSANIHYCSCIMELFAFEYQKVTHYLLIYAQHY